MKTHRPIHYMKIQGRPVLSGCGREKKEASLGKMNGHRSTFHPPVLVSSSYMASSDHTWCLLRGLPTPTNEEIPSEAAEFCVFPYITHLPNEDFCVFPKEFCVFSC